MRKLNITICILLFSVNCYADTCTEGLDCIITNTTQTGQTDVATCTQGTPSCTSGSYTVCDPYQNNGYTPPRTYYHKYTQNYTRSSIGTCIPPNPSTYTNGVKDPDEDGIDCGGSTGVVCVPLCPPNTMLVNVNTTPVCMVGIDTGRDIRGDCLPGSNLYMLTFNNITPPPAQTTTPVCGKSSVPSTPGAETINLPSDPGVIVPSDDPTSGATDGCKDIILPDGSKCISCVQPDGSTRIDCRNPTGTMTDTDTPPTTATTQEGFSQVTYSDGSVCTYTTDTNGQTLIACVGPDGITPTAAPGTATGDGLLDKIASNTGDSKQTLTNLLSSNKDSLGVQRFTLSELENTNKLIAQLLTKPGIVSSGGGTSTTVDLSSTNSKIDLTNSKLDTQIAAYNLQNTKINDFNDSLKLEKATNHDSVIASTTQTGDDSLSSLDLIIADAGNQIVGEFQPSQFPVSESITNKVKDVLPSPQACVDTPVNLTSHYQFVLKCTTFERFKNMFSWLLYVWTILSIYETLFTSSPKGK